MVYGGVDTKKFCPDEATPRGGTVLFGGRILPHKSVNDLIDALEPNIRAELVGPAPDARYLDELRLRARGKQIRFHTDCDDAALIDAYRRAACIVLPSVYRDMYGNETEIPELLGQTLLEGMACGTAAVCTNVASLPEVVENGATGLVVPPNDSRSLRQAIRWMFEHPGERAIMGERGRTRVAERFNWAAVATRCLEVYAA